MRNVRSFWSISPVCYRFSYYFCLYISVFLLGRQPKVKVNNKATCLNFVHLVFAGTCHTILKYSVNSQGKSLSMTLFCHCGGLKEGFPISPRYLDTWSSFDRCLGKMFLACQRKCHWGQILKFQKTDAILSQLSNSCMWVKILATAPEPCFHDPP